MGYWFPEFAPDRILIDLGTVQVYWYSVILLAGIAAGYAVTVLLAKQRQISEALVADAVFYSVLFGLIGARLWHVFIFQWSYYDEKLLEIPQIWKGGIAIQGALIVGIITLIIITRRRRASLWQLTDLFAPGVALGQAIGRWGNFFNQELYGRPTEVPWAIFIAPENRVAGFEQFEYFHPAFLYESLGSLILFMVLIGMARKKVANGAMTLFYFVGYGCIRFIVDFVRIDPMPGFAGLRSSQWISLLFVLGSIGLCAWFRRRSRRIAKV